MKKFLYKILFIIVLTLILLITFKKNINFKNIFYKKVYEENISFSTINYHYKKLFGSPIPFFDFIKKYEQPVFNEKIKYYEKKDYFDGVKLIVDNNYLVPNINEGMVVFIGDKENYPNTLIIEQSNGIYIWYSNIENINVDIYDYIESGKIIGNTIGDELYLVFKKDGVNLNYNDFI